MYKYFILLLSLTISGCEFFGGMSDAEYAAKAEQLFYDGDIEGAVIQLKNSLEKNPKNANARWLLAKVYIESGDGYSAEKELERAGQYGTGEGEIVPLMAKAYLLQRRYDDVLKLEEIPGFSDQAKSDIFSAHALAYLNQRNLNKAKESVASAIGLTPDSPYALVAMARTQIADQNREKAYENLKKVFSLNDQYAPAWSLYGDLKRDENDLEAALDAYTKAIQGYASKGNNLYKRARIYIGMNRLDDAKSDIRQLKKINAKHFRVNYLEGLVLFLQGKYDAALEPLQRSVGANETFEESLFYLGAAQHILGNDLLAQEHAERLYGLAPNSVVARKLLAQVRIRAKEYHDVERLLLPIVEQKENDSMASQLLAEAYMRQGKTAQAIELLSKLAEQYPESPDIQTSLGIGLLRQGSEASGFQALKTALQKDPEYQQADIALVLYHIGKKDFNRALTAAKDFVRRHEDSVVAHNLLAQSYLMSSMESEAIAEFSRVKQIQRGDKTANFELAKIAIRAKRYDQARKNYQDILDFHKGDLLTLIRLAALEKQQGNSKKVRELLDKAIQANPEAAQPRILSVKEYLAEGRTDKALAEMAPIQESQAPAVITTLGEIYQELGDFAQAKYFFSKLVGIAPNSAAANYSLAMAFAGLDEEKNFETSLMKALELDPDHLPARVSLARLYLKQGNLVRARKQYELLRSKAKSDSFDLRMLESSLLEAEGNFDQSLSVITDLYREAPNKAALLAYTRKLWKKGKQQEVIEELKSWLSGKEDAEVRLELAIALETLDDREASVEQYRMIMKTSENNPVVLNNLAWVLRESDSDQAMKLAEQALKINDKSVAAMDTMAFLLSKRSEHDRALRMIQRALDIQPDNPNLMYNSAEIYNKMGNNAKAKTVLQDLLANRQLSSALKARAQQLLNRM
ncbi:MAG: PEP-CTERM system TPR-repeat protein PrsT [Chromatiales bacterium]|jgi:putative PEP-CTERM system TPR-repeat lipoprotein